MNVLDVTSTLAYVLSNQQQQMDYSMCSILAMDVDSSGVVDVLDVVASIKIITE